MSLKKTAVAWTTFIVANLLGLVICVPAVLFTLFTIVRNWKKFRAPSPARHSMPPPLLSSEWTHKYAVVNGINLHYVTMGQGPLMLFVHGFPEFWYSWRHQLREFSKTHTVVAVDMRGYGDSDKPQQRSSYEMRHLTADMASLVESLNMGKAIAVSHDWGGVVMYACVYHYPELFSKLIVMNAPHSQAFRANASLAQLKKSWYMFFFQVPYVPELILKNFDYGFLKTLLRLSSGPLSDEDLECYKYAISRPGAVSALLHYYRGLFSPSSATAARSVKPGKSSIPTLVIWGENDIALTKELNRGLDRWIEQVTVEYVAGASHFVQSDAPDRVNAIMRKWLEG